MTARSFDGLVDHQVVDRTGFRPIPSFASRPSRGPQHCWARAPGGSGGSVSRHTWSARWQLVHRSVDGRSAWFDPGFGFLTAGRSFWVIIVYPHSTRARGERHARYERSRAPDRRGLRPGAPVPGGFIGFQIRPTPVCSVWILRQWGSSPRRRTTGDVVEITPVGCGAGTGGAGGREFLCLRGAAV